MSNVQMPGTQPRKSSQQGQAGLQIAAAVPGPQQIPAAIASIAMGANQKGPSQIQAVDSGGGGAMQRRMQALQASTDNLNALKDAESSLAQLPSPQQQQYAPMIKKARTLAEQEIA
jgi:hypothetical protein